MQGTGFGFGNKDGLALLQGGMAGQVKHIEAVAGVLAPEVAHFGDAAAFFHPQGEGQVSGKAQNLGFFPLKVEGWLYPLGGRWP